MLGLTRNARKDRHAGARRSRADDRRRHETFLERRTSSVLLLAAPLLFGWAWIEVLLGVAAFYHPNSIRYDGGRSFYLALGAGVMALLLAAMFASAGDRIEPRWRARVVVGLAAFVAGAHLILLATMPRVPETFVQTFDAETYRIPSTHTEWGNADGRVSLSVCQASGAGTYERPRDCERSVSIHLRFGSVERKVAHFTRIVDLDGGRQRTDDAGSRARARRCEGVGRWRWTDGGGSTLTLDSTSPSASRRVLIDFEGDRPEWFADCTPVYDLCRVTARYGSGVMDYEWRGTIQADTAPFRAFEQRIGTWLEGWRTE